MDITEIKNTFETILNTSDRDEREKALRLLDQCQLMWLRQCIEEVERLQHIESVMERTIRQQKERIDWLIQIDKERDGDFHIHADSLKRKCKEIEAKDKEIKELQFSLDFWIKGSAVQNKEIERLQGIIDVLNS